jgi:hypothetical protein
MWIIMLDFPLTYLGEVCNLQLFTPLRLTIFGTMWWLCIGVVLSFIIDRVKRSRRKMKLADTESQ